MNISIDNKIYLFRVPPTSRTEILCCFKALSKNGTYLARRYSESEQQAKARLTSPRLEARYRRHYPNGYQLVWWGWPVDAAAPSSNKRGREFIGAAQDHEFRQAMAAAEKHPQAIWR
jgi:hypothetical protein